MDAKRHDRDADGLEARKDPARARLPPRPHLKVRPSGTGRPSALASCRLAQATVQRTPVRCWYAKYCDAGIHGPDRTLPR